MKFTEKDIIVGLAALVGGIVSSVVVALPLEVLFNTPAVLAGLIEEPSKAIVLIIIALVLPDWLTSKTKCALFGGLAGLGFAFTENLLYYLREFVVESTEELIVPRTFLTLPTHALLSAIVGMGLLYAAARVKGGYRKALEFLFIAIILHMLWNAFPSILLLIINMAVFAFIYRTSDEYPVPSRKIGVLRIWPSSHEILITQNERTFGRNDLEKEISHDKLLLISKKHFVIIRDKGKFYIKDCESKGGTKLNGIEIKGEDKQELKIGSEITLPGNIKIEFTTKAEMDEMEVGVTLFEKPSVDGVKIMPKPPLSKLLLPDNHEIVIKEDENEFGREDFRGLFSNEELKRISRMHFKITRDEINDFFIEDLGSTNGTRLNGEEIKGSGKRKLEDNDEILIANVLRIGYAQ